MTNVNKNVFFVIIYVLVCSSALKTTTESICYPNPCGEGVCVEGSGYYTCICPPDRHYNENCVLVKENCFPNPCNEGVCIPLNEMTSYKCICSEGHDGTHCEIGPCPENPCKNGGSCTMYSKVQRCECLYGFYGELCEKGVTNSILLTGTDTLTKSTYSIPTITNTHVPLRTEILTETTYPMCDCGLHSLSCELNYDGNKICTCKTGFSQLNDACVDCYCGDQSINCSFGRNQEKKCLCRNSYAQKNGICKETCKHDVECLNGGICKFTNGTDGFCECHVNYSGDRCEVNNACRPIEDTCAEYGGICVIREGLPQCECPPDKEYKEGVCEMICDATKCVHGQCEIFGHSYKCRCFVGYTGKHCDEKSSPDKRNEIINCIYSISLPVTVITIVGVVCLLTFNSMKNKVKVQDPEKVNLI